MRLGTKFASETGASPPLDRIEVWETGIHQLANTNQRVDDGLRPLAFLIGLADRETLQMAANPPLGLAGGVVQVAPVALHGMVDCLLGQGRPFPCLIPLVVLQVRFLAQPLIGFAIDDGLLQVAGALPGRDKKQRVVPVAAGRVASAGWGLVEESDQFRLQILMLFMQVFRIENAKVDLVRFIGQVAALAGPQQHLERCPMLRTERVQNRFVHPALQPVVVIAQCQLPVFGHLAQTGLVREPEAASRLLADI